MSHMPLWLAPSVPVIPARSRTIVTPRSVQGDIHEHLVEGAIEEGRVEGHHRVHAGEGEPG